MTLPQAVDSICFDTLSSSHLVSACAIYIPDAYAFKRKTSVNVQAASGDFFTIVPGRLEFELPDLV